MQVQMAMFGELMDYNYGKMSHRTLTKSIFIIHCNLILQAYPALKIKSIRGQEKLLARPHDTQNP